METKMKQFKIIGISVRTTNENNQAMKDIPTGQTHLNSKYFSEVLIIPTSLEPFAPNAE